MNVGKIKKVEAVKGYELNEKDVGCKYHESCFTCPYRDCIRDKRYVITPSEITRTRSERQHAVEAYLAEQQEGKNGDTSGD